MGNPSLVLVAVLNVAVCQEATDKAAGCTLWASKKWIHPTQGSTTIGQSYQSLILTSLNATALVV